MTIVLDSRDMAQIDKIYQTGSQVWQQLSAGAKSVTSSDFVGVREVRINKMDGFVQPSDYKRNADNERHQINITKETLRLNHEDQFNYTLIKFIIFFNFIQV